MDEEARPAVALRRVSGKAMPQNTLADPEAIAANRRGEITPRQRAAFAEALRSRGRVELLAWFMGVLLVGLIIYSAMTARPVPAFKFLAYPVLALLAIPGGVVAWRALNLLARYDRARHEMSAGRIEPAVGSVVWIGCRYAARVSDLAGSRGRRLFSDRALNLLPGSYRFHFLPRSGWLLSAERLAPDEASSQRDLLSILMRANDFALESLPVTRTGRMAEAQRAQLVRWLWEMAALDLVIVVAIGIFAYFVWRAPNPPAVTAGLIALAAAVAIALVIFGWQEGGQIAADLRAGKVTAAEGPARKEIVHRLSSREDSYYYRMGALTFAVSEKGYEALIEGRSYRMHYLPHTKRLLSIEPLPAPADERVGSRPHPLCHRWRSDNGRLGRTDGIE